MAAKFTIESIDKTDKEEILKLTENIWEGHDYIPDLIDEWIEEGGFICGKVNGKIVALAKHTEQDEGVFWLEGLRVHPQYQGKGYGRKMIEGQIELLEEKGYRTLRFLTGDDRTPVKKVASEKGFEVKQSYRYLYLEEDDLSEIECELEPYEYDMDEVINEDRVRKVKDFVFSSEEYEEYKQEYLASWTCMRMDEDLIEREIERDNCFTIREDGKIDSLSFFYYYEPHESLSIPFISGSEEGIKQLIDYGLLKSIKEDRARYSIKTGSDWIASLAEERGLKRSDNGDVLLFEKRSE